MSSLSGCLVDVSLVGTWVQPGCKGDYVIQFLEVSEGVGKLMGKGGEKGPFSD